MIGQSELPPLPLAYRASELSCTLSPILSQSDKLSDNSDDMSSSITQISKDFGEFESDDDQPESNLTKTTDRNIEKSDDDIIFIKPLSDIFPFQNDLCHFVCQTNRRPPRSEFIWRLNGRKLQRQATLVRVKKNNNFNSKILTKKISQIVLVREFSGFQEFFESKFLKIFNF